MKNTMALSRGASRSGLRCFTVGGLLLAAAGTGIAEPSEEAEDQGSLDPTTILANRVDTDLSRVGSSVSVLDVGLLEKQGVHHLDEALKFSPGVVSESLGGQRGSSSSLFLRGTRTNQAHIVVDGMRISDSNFAAGGFLGSSRIDGLSRIEILRGPQGALYGGESIGGVLGLYSARGSGDPGGRIRVEGGSFDSWSGALESQGEIEGFAYAVGVGQEQTDNELPHNRFEMFSYTLRLDQAVSESLDVGLTLRGADTDFQAPSYGVSAPLDDDLRYTLATLFAEYRANEFWTTKLTVGLYDQTYDSNQPFDPNPIPDSYNTDATKYAVYWDNTLRWNEEHTTVTGAVYENSEFYYYSYWNNIWGLPPVSTDSRKRDQYGFYVNHIWDVTEDWNLTGGIRWEDYDDYGEEFTWRTSTAYTLPTTGTTFRASAGESFRPPSFVDLYGFGGQAPNPALKAEQAFGWDVGIEQTFCDGTCRLALTYFENRIQDAIRYAGGINVNTPGTTTTNGIEAAAEARCLDERLLLSLSYTWLERSLSGQPENIIALRVHGDITDKIGAGLTASYLADRSWGPTKLASYGVVGLYGNFQVTDNVRLTARIENLFDEDYEYYSGFGDTFPGRGRGIFGGVVIDF